MDGASLEGSSLTVNEAYERERPRKFAPNHGNRFNQEDPLEKALFEAQKALDKAYSLYQDRRRR